MKNLVLNVQSSNNNTNRLIHFKQQYSCNNIVSVIHESKISIKSIKRAKIFLKLHI